MVSVDFVNSCYGDDKVRIGLVVINKINFIKDVFVIWGIGILSFSFFVSICYVIFISKFVI